MALNVKLARIPGTVSDLVLNDGATVADAFSVAGFSYQSGESIKVDGVDGDTTTVLRDGSRIYVGTKAAKGNA